MPLILVACPDNYGKKTLSPRTRRQEVHRAPKKLARAVKWRRCLDFECRALGKIRKIIDSNLVFWEGIYPPPFRKLTNAPQKGDPFKRRWIISTNPSILFKRGNTAGGMTRSFRFFSGKKKNTTKNPRLDRDPAWSPEVWKSLHSPLKRASLEVTKSTNP